MRDLRKNQETLISGQNIPVKKIIFRWYKPIVVLAMIVSIILKPVLIAHLLGGWITKFFGTLTQSIKIEGVTSFNFLLIVFVFAFLFYFVKQWLKSKSKETISGTRAMSN